MMFLPQFVSPNIEASPREQLLLLGLILNVMGFLFNVSLVVLLSKVVDTLMKNTVSIKYQQRVVSFVFACLGGWMLSGLVG